MNGPQIMLFAIDEVPRTVVRPDHVFLVKGIPANEIEVPVTVDVPKGDRPGASRFFVPNPDGTGKSPGTLVHPDSVPVTGKELSYDSLEDYRQLKLPDQTITSYNYAKARRLYEVNCMVCHGPKMKGDGPIRPFMNRGPFPADLTHASTRETTDGELFAFISLGGRQGLSAALRNRKSTSPMPEFRRLLTEQERWNLVQYVRAQ